jgi:hypothetical protein
VGVRAGQLLGAARRGSVLAVDAFVVAVAGLAGGGLIATVDVDDLEHLAAHADNVRVVSIQRDAAAPSRRGDESSVHSHEMPPYSVRIEAPASTFPGAPR